MNSVVEGVVKVAKKYQITVPKEVRRRVGVEISDKLKVMEKSEGVILRKAGEKRSTLALAGCYKLYGFCISMDSRNPPAKGRIRGVCRILRG